MEYCGNLNEIHTILLSTIRRCFHQQDRYTPDDLAETILHDLVHHFGGQSIYIPKGRQEYEQKVQQIIAAKSHGDSISSIARSFSLTTRAVRNNLERARRKS